MEKRTFPIQVRTTCNLSTLEADAVVCTLPLGVISIPEGKPGHIEFFPPLPTRKQTAINRLGFGHYNKCALSFPNAFWSSAADFIGVVGSPVAGTDILFCNVNVVNDLPVIVMIYGGAYAEEVEKLTDAQVVGECMDVLQRVCGKSNIPGPIDYCVTRWGKDRFARGSFSYCPVGVDGAEELSVMSEPIYEESLAGGDPGVHHPLILFAGEATTPYHPSTIHGAYLSGIREAYRLDLALYPAQNNYLQFDDSYMYKRTFGLRRRFAQKKKETPLAIIPKLEVAPIALLNPGTRRSDRQAKQQSPQRVKRKLDTIAAAGVRKSRRQKENIPLGLPMVGGIHKDDIDASSISSHDEIIANDHPNEFCNSEDIALLRGVDVFGRDDGGMMRINAFMFPIPENNAVGAERRKKNSKILQKRYDELVSQGADNNVISNSIGSKWVASQESNYWWKARESSGKKDADKKTAESQVPSRHSSRRRTPQKTTSYEDL